MSDRIPAFGLRAGSYDDYALVQREAADWLSEWLPAQGKFKSCLEFGSGTGLFTRHLVERFEVVEASDSESSMVEKCRQKFPRSRHSTRNAWGIQTDAGRWDFVTAASLLQWSPDPVANLSNWRNLLRPGGRVLCGFFAAPSLPEIADVLPTGGPVNWRSPEEWRDCFREAGFGWTKVTSETRRYHYTNAIDLWKSLHRTGAVVSRRMTPSQLMQTFRSYEERFRDERGVYATWTFCRVLARSG